MSLVSSSILRIGHRHVCVVSYNKGSNIPCRKSVSDIVVFDITLFNKSKRVMHLFGPNISSQITSWFVKLCKKLYQVCCDRVRINTVLCMRFQESVKSQSMYLGAEDTARYNTSSFMSLIGITLTSSRGRSCVQTEYLVCYGLLDEDAVSMEQNRLKFSQKHHMRISPSGSVVNDNANNILLLIN